MSEFVSDATGHGNRETPNHKPLQNETVNELPRQGIESVDWRAVSRRYPTALRIHIAIVAGIFVFLPWCGFFVLSYLPIAPVIIENICAAIVFSFLLFVWAPRRARHTKYLLRELDINLQKGFWWHYSTSIAINRIQHLEVSQGPIERALGLAKLSIFTAGGMKSDMIIPGLEVDIAQQLKTHLLEQVGSEETEDELL